MTITVQGSESIADIERYAAALNESRADTNLKLPTRLRDDKLGGRAALIQLILSWARRNRQARLITHIQSVEQVGSQLTNFADEDHGLIALVVSPAVTTLRGASLEELISLHVKEPYSSVYKMPRLKGSRAFFMIADHRSDALADSFYDHLAVPDEMRAERKYSFIKEVNNRITQCIRLTRGTLLTAEQRQSVGEIVYELFSNTERWAQLDLSGKPLEPRARGMLLNVHSDVATFEKAAADSPPLKGYLADILPSLGERPTFLEVSIFDSGIGLAQRKLGRAITDEMSLEEERAFVIDCLLEHGTSSPDETEGVGLYLILKLLTKGRGFLRYRGGRLSLYRDFAARPYLPVKFQSRAARMEQRSTRPDSSFRKKLAYLVDWSSREVGATAMPRLDGALFTLLLPMQRAAPVPLQLDLTLSSPQ